MDDFSPASICERFGLGEAFASCEAAGVSTHQVWRVDTATGPYAVKRMADRPGVVERISAAFVIEQRAWTRGVPAAEPVLVRAGDPEEGSSLAHIGGAVVRVHRWLGGRPPTVTDLDAGLAAQAGRLVAEVHAAGDVHQFGTDHERGAGARPTQGRPSPIDELVELAAGTALGPAVKDTARALADLWTATRPRAGLGHPVDSHGDLHPRNVQLCTDGRLALLDWDNATTVEAEGEAVAAAVDWGSRVDGSVDPAPFVALADSYRTHAARPLPASAWVFGTWVGGYVGWLRYNLDERASAGRDPDVCLVEAQRTLARLQWLAGNLDRLAGRLA